jgi:hypothetical protein
MDEAIDIAVCGVHFDNGKVFDLLRYIRGHYLAHDLPVFMLLATGSRYSPAIVHGVRRAAQIMGVTAFTDMTRLIEKVGKQQAVEILRQGLRDARRGQEQTDAAGRNAPLAAPELENAAS